MCLIQGLEVVTVSSSSVRSVIIREVINRMECDANGVSPVPGLKPHRREGNMILACFPPQHMCQILGSALSLKPWLLSIFVTDAVNICNSQNNFDEPVLVSNHGNLISSVFGKPLVRCKEGFAVPSAGKYGWKTC